MSDALREVTDEKIMKYLDTTRRALEKAQIIAPDPSYAMDMARDFRNMAESYYKDAIHFAENGDHVNAFACVNYAHGWLDAGARLGLFEHEGDDVLFTLRA